MSINYKKIGERIQTARKIKGLSMSELSDLVCISAKSIAFIEAGEAQITLDILLPLCSALWVSPNDVLEGEYTPPPKMTDKESSILRELEEMIEQTRNQSLSSGTVIKNSDAAMNDIRKMVYEQRAAGVGVSKKPSSPPPKKKPSSHW